MYMMDRKLINKKIQNNIERRLINYGSEEKQKKINSKT